MAISDFVTSSRQGVVRLRAGEASVVLTYDRGDLVVGNLLLRGPHPVSFSAFVTGSGLDPNGSEMVGFLRAHEIVDVEYKLEGSDFGGVDRSLTVHGCRCIDVDFRESMGGNTVVFSLVGERVTGDLLPWLDPACSAA